MLSWFYLFLAVIAETTFNVGLYYARGWTVWWPSVLAVAAGISTAIFLGLAMKHLPMGLAIVIWGGAATLASAIYGMVALGEPCTPWRLVFIAIVIGGMTGLKFTSPA